MTLEDNNVKWDNNIGYIMVMIGSAIGLGNIWRYPYVAYTNGAGTFLIPYFCAILLLGIPFILLESSVGYKFKTSLSNVLKSINSKFEFIGWFVPLCTFLILCYYVCVVGWDLIYIFLSFFKAWGSNPGSFFSVNLLHSHNDLSGLLIIIWPVLLSIIVIWFIIWGISRTDLNSGIGRVTKILIPGLVLLMIIIVAFSITLPGASLGYSALMHLDWGRLSDFNIWLAAFGQILFSLSLGFAVNVSYSSYLTDSADLIKNGLIIIASNCSFEVFTAFGVFSILGFMAFTQGVPVDSVVTAGSGLIFVVYPTVFNSMGFMGSVMGFLFFLCVFFAGITTTVSMLEPLSLNISHKFGFSRKVCSSILCIVGFLFSLVFATGSGNFILNICDTFINNFAILLGIICQCLIFGWYYKIDDLLDLINSSSSFNLGRYWVVLIKFVTPLILFIIWVTGVFNLVLSNDFSALIVELVITVVLIVVPSVLTLLPERV